MTKVGQNGYMLSTSLENSDELKSEFTTDSCFLIKNPLEFTAAVSNALPGCSQMYLGFCNYQTHRTVEKSIPNMTITDFTDEKGSLIFGGKGMNNRINELVGNGIDLMFLKGIKYQTQSEFRFVWTINTEHYTMKEDLTVDCKEAIQHCERLDL